MIWRVGKVEKPIVIKTWSYCSIQVTATTEANYEEK